MKQPAVATDKQSKQHLAIYFLRGSRGATIDGLLGGGVL
jgi:hypothetical protein